MPIYYILYYNLTGKNAEVEVEVEVEGCESSSAKG